MIEQFGQKTFISSAKHGPLNHSKSHDYRYYSPKNLWVSVDTALAEISKTKLAQLPGGKTMFHTKEGAQSMYVDATTLMMAPSSFAHPDQSIAWDKDNWVKQFQTFTTTSTPSSKPKRR